MSSEAWIPPFDGKGKNLGYFEFAEPAGRMPPTLNTDFLVHLEDGVAKGKDLRSGKEYGPSPALPAVLNAIPKQGPGLLVKGDYPTGVIHLLLPIEDVTFYSNGTSTERRDMYISNADDVTISNCSFLPTEPPYNLKEELSPSRVLILNSYFAKGAAGLNLVAGANRVHGSTSPPSEACDTTTVPAGSTSTTANHSLRFTPKIIRITPLDNLGGRSFWVSNVTSTSFTINISSADTVNHAFIWEAEVGWV